MGRTLSKKQKILIIAVSVVLILGVIGGTMYFTGAWQPVYYKFNVWGFESANRRAQKGEVVFTGDSITEFCDLKKFYPEIIAHNRGIGGDTTTGLLKRMDESVFDLEPKVVVLLIGINDLAFYDRSPEEVLTNYRKIILRIKKELPDTKVILQSVYPVNDKSFGGEVFKDNGKIVAVNAGIKTLAEEFSYTYADLFSILEDGNGFLKREYAGDGLHPNAECYKAIAAYLTPIILSLKGE